MSVRVSGIGLYVHLPFCIRKCRYCDFNSAPASFKERAQYVLALEAEIRARTAGEPYLPRSEATPGAATVSTVYFGGGTPTVYEVRDLVHVLDCLRNSFRIDEDAEITCEANPGTVTARSLADLRAGGFSRLSVGVQSFRDEELEFLGRIHTAAVAERAVVEARAAGFTNLSIDLMRALPGQSLQDWEYSLRQAMALTPEHISTYGLSIEPGTPLARDLEAGRIQPCDEDTQVAMFELTHEALTRAGYEHYEISNYARHSAGGPGATVVSPFRCRHNINYWRNGEYLGLGAGAWSYQGGVRSRNVASYSNYIAAALAGLVPIVERDEPDATTQLGETIMLGLRLADGVRYAELEERFGVRIAQDYAPQIAQLRSLGLLEATEEGLRLTVRGYLVQSEVAQMFLR